MIDMWIGRLTGALAKGMREPGQDLIVAAISEVLLCGGL